MKKLYMIGNTHFDPVWLWRWDEALASIRSTFRSALDRMNENPDFIYSFCTPAVFEWIEKTDIKLFEEIKKRVKEGRWELCEGWWVQADCNAPCGESYIRQGLYAREYLKTHFGKTSDTVFNIDSFGHNMQLPQILRGCGFRNYVFWRPNEAHKELPKPLFDWVGFVLGIVAAVTLIATNKNVNGKRSYLYPLIPWNGNAMARLFFRLKKHD